MSKGPAADLCAISKTASTAARAQWLPRVRRHEWLSAHKRCGGAVACRLVRLVAWAMAAVLWAFAGSAQAQIVESFRGNTLTNSWTFPGATNLACLTVAGGAVPCAGTVSNYNDTTTNGWLRFTTATGNQQGTAILNTPLSLSSGFTITFTYSMYSGTLADGISVFFIDPSVANAGTGGAYGGGLGYCQILGGILGIGIDEYGNFPNTTSNSCNGTGPGFENSNFSVRGGAKATTPWLFLTGSGVISNTALRTDAGWAAPATGTCAAASCRRTGAKIQIGFFPDPTCNPSGQYRLTVTPLTAGSTIPAQNLCVSSTSLGAIPSVLKIGFAASTGGSNQYQEIRDLTITQSADLAITKTDGVNTVVTGTSTTYSVLVTNNGPSVGDGAVLTDPAAGGLTTTGVTCSVPSGSSAVCPGTAALTVAALQSSGGIAIPTLPSGSSLSFAITATVTATSGTVTNTAKIATSPSNPFITDPNINNNSAADSDFVGPQTLLTLQKNVVGRAVATDDFSAQLKNGATVVASATTNGSANLNTATTGARLVTAGTPYTLTEVGAGTPAASLAAYSTTIDCNNATSGSITTLPSGTGQSFSVTPQSGDNITCTLTNTPKVAQLTVTKTASATQFVAGQSAQYTINVQNTGLASTSGNLTIVDTLPSGITLTGVSGSGWSCVGTSALTCTYSGILTSASNTNLVLTVAVGGNAVSGTNSATASGGGDGSCPAATRCTGVTPNIAVTPKVDIAIVKTDTNTPAGTYTPGGTGSYILTVTNNGPSTLTNGQITDNLPAGVTLNGSWTCVAAVPANGATCSAASGTTLGSLNALTVTIPPGTGSPSSTRISITIPVTYSGNPAAY